MMTPLILDKVCVIIRKEKVCVININGAPYMPQQQAKDLPTLFQKKKQMLLSFGAGK
jgi:hypothetical protein